MSELIQIKDKSKSTTTENKFVLLRGLLILVLNKINLRKIFIYLFLFWVTSNRGLYIFQKGRKNNLKFKLFYDLLTFFIDHEDYPHSHKLLNDLSCFFLTNIISNNHKYCCDMDKATWLYLINIYSTNFLNYQLGTSTIDPLVSIKCLRMIINKCHLYTGSFIMSKLYSFFNLAVVNLK